MTQPSPGLTPGGHTIDDPIPKYGMAVVGIADPDRLFQIDELVTGGNAGHFRVRQ